HHTRDRTGRYPRQRGQLVQGEPLLICGQLRYFLGPPDRREELGNIVLVDVGQLLQFAYVAASQDAPDAGERLVDVLLCGIVVLDCPREVVEVFRQRALVVLRERVFLLLIFPPDADTGQLRVTGKFRQHTPGDLLAGGQFHLEAFARGIGVAAVPHLRPALCADGARGVPGDALAVWCTRLTTGQGVGDDLRPVERGHGRFLSQNDRAAAPLRFSGRK